MNEVKRYKAVINDKPYKPYAYCEESSDGIYVRLEDYTALQEQLTATTNSLTNAQEALKSAGVEADTVQAGVMELVSRMNQVVTENAALKYVLIAVRDHWFKSSGGAQYEWQIESQTLQEAINQELETPATDAYLNAVRAEGADKVAEYHFVRIDALKEVSRQGYLFHKAAYSDAVSVANLLRAGNAGKDGSHE